MAKRWMVEVPLSEDRVHTRDPWRPVKEGVDTKIQAHEWARTERLFKRLGIYRVRPYEI